MAEYREIAKTGDVLPGMMKGFKSDGRDIIIANVAGEYYAAEGRCPHMKANLAKGKLNGAIVTCPLHGSQFDLKTGKVMRWVGAQGLMGTMGKLMSALGIAAKKEKPLTVYEVKVQGEKILAKIG
jgi:3-phenylpropionate/trans-cinnamate dioxygenase ferredoxin component